MCSASVSKTTGPGALLQVEVVKLHIKLCSQGGLSSSPTLWCWTVRNCILGHLCDMPVPRAFVGVGVKIQLLNRGEDARPRRAEQFGCKSSERRLPPCSEESGVARPPVLLETSGPPLANGRPGAQTSCNRCKALCCLFSLPGTPWDRTLILLFFPPLWYRKLFYGVNEIAVKVPSVFKLLIKEVRSLLLTVWLPRGGGHLALTELEQFLNGCPCWVGVAALSLPGQTGALVASWWWPSSAT